MKWLDWLLFRIDFFVYSLPVRFRRWRERRAAAKRSSQAPPARKTQGE